MGFQQELANLDRAVALERVGGDEKLLQEIAGLFLAEYPRLLSEIREAIDRCNAPALERAAHTLKGSVGNFGATAASRAALDLEIMGRNRDLENGPDALLALESHLERLRPELITLSRGGANVLL